MLLLAVTVMLVYPTQNQCRQPFLDVPAQGKAPGRQLLIMLFTKFYYLQFAAGCASMAMPDGAGSMGRRRLPPFFDMRCVTDDGRCMKNAGRGRKRCVRVGRRVPFNPLKHQPSTLPPSGALPWLKVAWLHWFPIRVYRFSSVVERSPKAF